MYPLIFRQDTLLCFICFVNDGFPINRRVQDARTLFEEVNEDDFLSASPLHTYLRTFSWFLTLVSHLQAGSMTKWSPSSSKILGAKQFITSLIEKKLNIVIDMPSVQGGTSTTGNVVRRCFNASMIARKISFTRFYP